MLTDSEHTVNQPVSRCDEHIERKTLSQTHSKLPFCLPLLLGCYGNSALKGGLAVLFQVSQSTQPLFQGNNYSLSWLYNPKDVKTRPSNSMPGLDEFLLSPGQNEESSRFMMNDCRLDSQLMLHRSL